VRRAKKLNGRRRRSVTAVRVRVDCSAW